MNRKYNPFQLSSLSLGTSVTIVAIVVMTLVAELNGGFKGFLTDLSGHHWVSKGLLASGLFVVTWLASALVLREEPRKMRTWALVVVGISLLGVMVVFLFYLAHFLTA